MQSGKTGNMIIRLPIYPETAMERNKKVYSRYGYDMYHYREEKDKDIRFWFIKRELSSQAIAYFKPRLVSQIIILR